MKKEQLKPCPFCGGKPYVTTIKETVRHGVYVITSFVSCPQCTANGPGKDNWDFPNEDREQLAIDAWNKRKAT